MIALAAAIESARACDAAIAAFGGGGSAASRGREVEDTGGSGNRRAFQIWYPTNPTASATATVIAKPTHLLRVGNAPTPLIAGSGIISGSTFTRRIGYGAPRRRVRARHSRPVHGALVLVVLDQLRGAVALPVDERAKPAALENPVVVNLLVERNVRAALRRVRVRAEESAGGLVPLGGDHEPALPALGEARAMRFEIERGRRRRQIRRAVVPADERRAAATHLELLPEPLGIRNLHRLVFRDRMSGAQRARDAEKAPMCLRALARLADEEAEELLLGRGGEMANDFAQRALRDENRGRRELHGASKPFHRRPQNRAVVGERLPNLERRRWACLGVPLSQMVTSEGHLYTRSSHVARVSHRKHRLKIGSITSARACGGACHHDTPPSNACCGGRMCPGRGTDGCIQREGARPESGCISVTKKAQRETSVCHVARYDTFHWRRIWSI